MHLPPEDYYGIAAIGLCKAVASWDADKAKLSYYALTVIRNELLQECRKENRRIKAISLNAPMSAMDSDITLGDTIPAEDKLEAWENGEEVRTAIIKACLTDRDRNIMWQWAAGVRQKDIAVNVGICRTYVNRIINKCKKRIVESRT